MIPEKQNAQQDNQVLEKNKTKDNELKTNDNMSKMDNKILICVSIIQAIGFIMTIVNRGNISLVLLTMVVTNSLSQMGIDFFKGKNKPLFSAMFRAIPIFVAVAAYFLSLPAK